MGFSWMFRFNKHLSPLAKKNNLPRKQKKQWQSHWPPKKNIIPHLSGEDLLDFNVWNVATYPPTYRLHTPKKPDPPPPQISRQLVVVEMVSSLELMAPRRSWKSNVRRPKGPSKARDFPRRTSPWRFFLEKRSTSGPTWCLLKKFFVVVEANLFR